MIVSRSTEESVRLIATALGSLADTLTKMAGSLEELEHRVEHIESFLESLEIDYEEETESGPSEEIRYIVDGQGSILPCGFEGDSEDLARWYGEGGPCPQED